MRNVGLQAAGSSGRAGSVLKMVFEVGPKDGEREDLIMKAGDSYHITPFTTHRMIALEDTHILEASTTELDDVVRLEDKYGRAGTKAP